jgi:geranylgeranyl reductase family protein
MPEYSADVLVVGGGPGGLFAAAKLAGSGVRTVVCEEHSTIGEPVHCTGIIAAESFDEFDLPRQTTLNTLTAATFVSPSGVRLDYRTSTPLATVIDRSAFDQSLAQRAEAAGADIRCGIRISTIEIDRSGARAIAGDTLLHARVVVLACGANYAFQRRLGLGLPRLYLHTAQRELSASRLLDVELHFGREIASEGFSWAVPVARPDGPRVRVGVMARHDTLASYERMVRRVRDRWGLDDEQGPPRQKILPLGAIERTYGDRLLAIGDAAGLVKPTTGGGIYYSIVTASLAADVVVEALRRDRFEAEALSMYERAWRAHLDDELKAQHALRQVASELSDTAIDALFELARHDGIMPIVRATAQFNRHRDLIRALFSHPPARRIFFRSVLG